ncbi:GNAT family N-acetyltransferase [Leclercia adecarboxylata]|uniref:GNAT family N-acetyltransferase n=1 Tax=Leclercia TaxID=83654 RepID=UPI000CD1F9CB|nr:MULTISPECIES: GNAT family protein [Leclercia]POV34542.1 GNAT family N-acetyltransferase [Leclercia sp. LSNIH5]POW67033.1 GNAT family N-acetyltransferase [Leclercia sp. LSNIH2]AUU84421.1 GNAT family N-acetyltransferase [Leclercia sp. LSNIH1]MCZ7837924.1 GNAT family N-acetyltransferase [Leclercia adecarboxylata]MEB5751666.1 GNAT family N-acetyltransferase [Leclercia adecarboxylata]
MPEMNIWGQMVNDPVPGWQGASVLERGVLEGRFCRLEPLNAHQHASDLFEAYALGDDSDWTWLASNQPASVEETASWVQGKVQDKALVPFAVIDRQSERAVGLVCYMAIEQQLGSVEIGHVTWSRKMKNSPLGTEAIWLLLKYGFERGYRRLEWKCDSMNIPSRRAAERLGFTWEGRLRQKLVRKGRNRDSDMLSIIDSEWPERDAALRGWLAADNFDNDGRQIKRLEAFHARPETA